MNKIDFNKAVLTENSTPASAADGNIIAYKDLILPILAQEAVAVNPRKIVAWVDALNDSGVLEIDDADLTDMEKLVCGSERLSPLGKGRFLSLFDGARRAG